MLLSAPAQGKDSSPIHGSSTRRGRHRCGDVGNALALSTCPQRQQQQKTAARNLAENYPHDFTMRQFFGKKTREEFTTGNLRTYVECGTRARNGRSYGGRSLFTI